MRELSNNSNELSQARKDRPRSQILYTRWYLLHKIYKSKVFNLEIRNFAKKAVHRGKTF